MNLQDIWSPKGDAVSAKSDKTGRASIDILNVERSHESQGRHVECGDGGNACLVPFVAQIEYPPYGWVRSNCHDRLLVKQTLDANDLNLIRIIDQPFMLYMMPLLISKSRPHIDADSNLVEAMTEAPEESTRTVEKISGDEQSSHTECSGLRQTRSIIPARVARPAGVGLHCRKDANAP